MNTWAELDAYRERVPAHVVTVLDQAYFEYVDHPDYADGIEDYEGRSEGDRAAHVLEDLRLAGLRVGYGIGPAELLLRSARSGARSTSPRPPGRRPRQPRCSRREGRAERRRRLNAEGRPAIVEALRDHGFEPVEPSVANFVFAEVGDDSRPSSSSCCARG